MRQIKAILLLTFFMVVNTAFANQVNAPLPGGNYPEASTRFLTQEDLRNKSGWDLTIMRNEIFVRHGYRFRSEEMKAYFQKQKWYAPQYDDVTSKLSDIEIANVKLLKQQEDKIQPKITSTGIGERIEKQKREVVFKTSWGSGLSELGRTMGQEANSEGPSSFAVDHSGKFFVLDQVNKRIQVFDYTGLHLKSIPIPSETFSDMDIDPSGNLFLLDALVYKIVLYLDPMGSILKEIKLMGLGIPNPSRVRELYYRRDGLWIMMEDPFEAAEPLGLKRSENTSSRCSWSSA